MKKNLSKKRSILITILALTFFLAKATFFSMPVVMANQQLAANPTSAKTNASTGPNTIDSQVTQEDLDRFNPLIQDSDQENNLNTPAKIINRVLNYLFPIAGFILFIMIVWGGFEMMTSAAGKKGLESGKQRVTAAIIGFLLLFASYWLAQLMEVILNVKILG